MEFEYEKSVLSICTGLLENGAEISRVEDTAKRLLVSNGNKEINIFCLSSILIISTENTTLVKRIKKNDINLLKIDYLNSLSRAICNGKIPPKEECGYPFFIQALAVILGCGAYCIYFGGSIYEAIFAAITGIIINFRKSFMTASFSRILSDSLIAGLFSVIASRLFPTITYDKIMIGSIMLLVPGITLVNGVRDIMKADVLSGLIELTEAVFTAIAISLGYSAAQVIL